MRNLWRRIISKIINLPTIIIATLGSDFTFDAAAQNQFPPSTDSVRSQCHALVIVDDAILEDTEHLEAILTPPEGVARLQVGVTRIGVAISDDDTVTVGFNQTSQYVVDEDAEAEEDRVVNVCLQMMGDIEREVSVTVTSQAGTAQHRKNCKKNFLF